MDYKVLSSINSPSDVKKLNNADINTLCDEIRSCIIETVSQNGGHLASNLGAVELTVALHKVFDSPEDAIIFDVGHQCYTHKLLTGRFKDFSTIRLENGISGFMRPNESEHDPFVTGHSSNSISAAYGIYKAKQINGQNGSAIAVIGDGALTGGMAYEAINNAGQEKGNFIVVLNDNKMSISQNVGALSKGFTRIRNKPKYHKFKGAFGKFLLKIPFIGGFMYRRTFSIKESLKRLIYKNNFFSYMGFNYLGPVDGHDIHAVENLLKIAKNYNRPCLVHVITLKGKGYYYAEEKPNNYHGVSSFDIEAGADISGKISFSSVAGDTLCDLARVDSKICAITAAMTEGTGLENFANEFSDRFFDVGIAEEHAVTFASGLATGGAKPYFLVYSTFLQRGFDQIIHDAAIAGVNLKLLVDRAGFVGEDGETHQGLFDVSYLSMVPGMNIYSPSSYEELSYRINLSAHTNELCAIRYPRGTEKVPLDFDFTGEFDVLNDNKSKAVVTYGRLFGEASEALEKNDAFSIVKLNKIYPLSDALLSKLSTFPEIYIFEEAIKKGGIGECISSALNELGYKGKVTVKAVDNSFVSAASIRSDLNKYGLDSASILKTVLNEG